MCFLIQSHAGVLCISYTTFFFVCHFLSIFFRSEGHLFCYTCIETWCKTRKTCPQDRKSLKGGVAGMSKSRVVSSSQKTVLFALFCFAVFVCEKQGVFDCCFRVWQVATLIGKLAVRCTHGGSGVSGAGGGEQKSKPKTKGEASKRKRGGSEEEDSFCPWTGKLNTRDKHLQGCTFEQEKCSFKGCSVLVQRRLLSDHQNDCKHRPWECDHCKSKMQFSQRSSHYKVGSLVCLLFRQL